MFPECLYLLQELWPSLACSSAHFFIHNGNCPHRVTNYTHMKWTMPTKYYIIAVKSLVDSGFTFPSVIAQTAAHPFSEVHALGPHAERGSGQTCTWLHFAGMFYHYRVSCGPVYSDITMNHWSILLRVKINQEHFWLPPVSACGLTARLPHGPERGPTVRLTSITELCNSLFSLSSAVWSGRMQWWERSTNDAISCGTVPSRCSRQTVETSSSYSTPTREINYTTS